MYLYVTYKSKSVLRKTSGALIFMSSVAAAASMIYLHRTMLHSSNWSGNNIGDVTVKHQRFSLCEY